MPTLTIVQNEDGTVDVQTDLEDTELLRDMLFAALKQIKE